jgi:glycosyltransferase involved in cell wall biosynthesis
MQESQTRTSTGRPLVSVVVPIFNEENGIVQLHEEIRHALDNSGVSAEIIYVNDGSTDSSMGQLRDLYARDPDVVIVSLSRNFGKEIALTAGLDRAGGDAVVILDADLQDPPRLIPEMIRIWQQGHDVVYGKRSNRKGEGPFKKSTSFLFYRVIQRLSKVWIPEDTGDFRLMSRRAVNAVLAMHERRRFMKGLFAWIGYSQVPLEYERDPRVTGRSKWNYWRLWDLAVEGVTSFTTVPLRLVSYLGLFVSLGAIIYALVVVYKAVFFGEEVRGYPSMMVVILLLGGVQLLGIGVLGEYLGRTYEESKRRPLYLVEEELRHSAKREAKSP